MLPEISVGSGVLDFNSIKNMMKRTLAYFAICLGFLAISCVGGQKKQIRTGVLSASLPLEGTEWKLLEMDGMRKASFRTDSAAFTLSFQSDSVSRIFGCGACNRFFGAYTAVPDTLWIRVQGRTQMFCPELEDEERFLQVLDSTRSYLINVDTLYLYDGNNLETAVFTGRLILPQEIEGK